MAEETDKPDSPARKLPPPDIAKGPPPPPVPPAAATKEEPSPGSEPPLKVKVDPKSSEHDVDEKPDEDRPGADAGMPKRVLGAFLDFVIGAGLYLGAILILPRFLDWSAYLLPIAYLVTRDSLPFLDGQSIGKKAMGTRAVTSDGRPLTGDWQPGLIRNAVLLIPFFALVELVVLLTRQDGPKPLLRLGDEWAKTKVVNAGDPAAENAEEAAGDEPEEAS